MTLTGFEPRVPGGAALLATALVFAGCSAGSMEPANSAAQPEQATAAAEPASRLPRASKAPEKRTGLWQGGAPPVNKSAAGIDTYYQISGPKADGIVSLRLRFEGVVANDAEVRFNTLDGAAFEPATQSIEWQLPAGTASEVQLTLRVPEGDSYINLSLQQRHRSSARAILLHR